ncbi:MAG: phage tail tape measure protein [Halobacteriota archaeon]|nr:phage tail tape measure protein [Halobacteriota archaeon]
MVLGILLKVSKSGEGNIDDLNQKLKGAATGFKKVATGAGILGGAIAGMGAVSLKTFGDFEKEMAMVQSVTGTAGEEFDALTQKARDLGESTIFSARQTAEGMKYLGMAGMEVGEILGGMETVLNVATAGQLELGQAADIVTNIMGAYGIKIEDLSHASDVLVRAFQNSNTNLVQLGEAFTYVGPVAKTAGFKFEETGAALMILADAGIRSSMAGTTLRGSIVRLLNPSAEAADTIERLGLDIYDYGEMADTATEALRPMRDATKRAEDAFITQNKVLQGLRASYAETTAEMSNMTAEMDDLGDQQAAIRLKIKKIRYEAAKEGRELTDDEIEEIQKAELEITGLGIKYDELAIKKDELSESSQDMQSTLSEEEAKHKELGDSLDTQKKKLSEAEKAWDQSSRSLKGWGDIVEELAESGANTADMMEIFGQRAGPGMTLLVEQGADSIRALTDDLIASDGAAAATAATMGDTLWAETMRTKSAMEEASIAAGEGLSPAYEELLQKTIPVINKFAEFTAANPALVTSIVTVGAALAGLAILLPIVTTAASSLAVVVGVLTWPVLAVAAAIASLVTIGYTLWRMWDENRKLALVLTFVFSALFGPLIPMAIMIVKNWDRVKAIFAAVVNTIRGAFQGVVGFFSSLGRSIQGGISNIYNILRYPFIRARDTIYQLFVSLRNGIVSIFSNIGNALLTPMKAAANAVIGVFNSMIGFLSRKKLFSITVPPWVPGIGGKGYTLRLPYISKLPTFEHGGVVPGRPGEPRLVVAHGGEKFLGKGEGSMGTGNVTLNLYIDYLSGDRESAERLGDTVLKVIRSRQRAGLGEAVGY